MALDRRKFNRDFLAASAAYAAVLVGTRYAAGQFTFEGVSLLVLAAAPIVPAIAMTGVFIRHYHAMDELQRRIQVQAFAAAALLVGLASFSLGLLEDVALPRLSMIWVLPALIFTWGAFACVLRWRYTR